MKPFLIKRLDDMSARLADLEFLLARADVAADAQAYRTLSREHAGLLAATQRYATWRKRRADLELAAQLQSDADADMAALATEEAAAAEAELRDLEAQLQRIVIPADPDDGRAAFLEIRAGTGGDESALFAADLLRMYSRFADRMGWRIELLSESASDLGGLREVVARVSAPVAVSQDGGDDATGVYGMLRFESGGHRVQRVPATESQGRIHTSACTVAVMPEPDEAAAVRLDPSQLRIDTFRASGAGGQHVNKTDSAVRITHLPTGLVAECQDDRSQHRNKARALQVLAARIEERERSERLQRDAALRRGLIGTGDRSDRIRTYNFPQGRVTDHRINLTLYRLGAVLEGDLSELIRALRHAHEAQLLAEMERDASGG